jgi:hypothetical protein
MGLLQRFGPVTQGLTSTSRRVLQVAASFVFFPDDKVGRPRQATALNQPATMIRVNQPSDIRVLPGRQVPATNAPIINC